MGTREAVLFDKSWPGWLPVIPSFGLAVSILILTDHRWVSVLRTVIPSSSFPVLQPPEVSPGPTFAFFGAHMRVPKFGTKFWQCYPNLTDVIFLTSLLPRFRLPDGWHTSSVTVAHATLGGVTTSNVTVHWLGKSVQTPPPPVPPISLPSRTLLTILDTVQPGVFHAAPLAASVPGRVTQIAEHPPCYDGRGLVPSGSPASSLFLVPSVRSLRTGWVVRPLSCKELLLSLDFPVSWICALDDNVTGWEVWQIMSRLPLKLLVGGARSLLALRGITSISISRRGLVKDKRIGSKDDDGRRDLVLGRANITSATKSTHDAKLAKDDASGIPTYLWDEHVWNELPEAKVRAMSENTGLQNVLEDVVVQVAKVDRTADAPNVARFILEFLPLRSPESTLDSLRGFLFRYWQRHLFLEWWKIVNTNNTLSPLDIAAGRDCLRRALTSSWWAWDNGSRCFPWRWPTFYQKAIRDGLRVWTKQKVKPWFRAQPREPDDVKRSVIASKINVIRTRGYVAKGKIESCISYFDVPKALTDVRMVYDGTKSGLNDTLWVPRFSLPTVESHLRAMLPGYFMADLDIGEMFHNFMLDEALRAQCGIDLTPYYPAELQPGEKYVRERWERLLMGWLPSPYAACQAILIAKDFLMGDRLNGTNPFRWDFVHLNLPGSPVYDPSVPWVAKVRGSDGKIATDLFIYVDDLRVTSPEATECWKAARQVASRLGYLGIQDASRKRQGASQTPEPWAGSVVYTDSEAVYVLVSDEKWKKTKDILARIWSEMLMSTDGMLSRKQLERDRGFLIYVSRTYPELRPYLKGIHLTLDSWRPGRDDDGWRYSNDVARAMEAAGRFVVPDEDNSLGPERVLAVPLLREGLTALLSLTSDEKAPLRVVRVTSMVYVFYGFGDASGKGFGSSFETTDGIHYRYGQWCCEKQEKSSNYRELQNLVDAIEDEIAVGRLKDCELFLFTDNWVSECAYSKGYSDSPELTRLVLQLRKAVMRVGITLHLLHVAGTRMIAQGTDGLSRGDLQEGVMTGQAMASFIPLHLSALDRSPRLKNWIKDWACAAGSVNFLTPTEWYTGPEREGIWIWTPPPAAADVAIELLYEHRHKHPELSHVLVVPRLMTGRFRKHALKQADVYLPVSLDFLFWSQEWHEPLLIFMFLPISYSKPWCLKGDPLVTEFTDNMSRMWSLPPGRSGGNLREFLASTRKMGRV